MPAVPDANPRAHLPIPEAQSYSVLCFPPPHLWACVPCLECLAALSSTRERNFPFASTILARSVALTACGVCDVFSGHRHALPVGFCVGSWVNPVILSGDGAPSHYRFLNPPTCMPALTSLLPPVQSSAQPRICLPINHTCSYPSPK